VLARAPARVQQPGTSTKPQDSAARCGPVAHCVPACEPVAHNVPACGPVAHSVLACRPVAHSVPACRPVAHSVPACGLVAHSVPTCGPVAHSVPACGLVAHNVPACEPVAYNVPACGPVAHSVPACHQKQKRGASAARTQWEGAGRAHAPGHFSTHGLQLHAAALLCRRRRPLTGRKRPQQPPQSLSHQGHTPAQRGRAVAHGARQQRGCRAEQAVHGSVATCGQKVKVGVRQAWGLDGLEDSADEAHERWAWTAQVHSVCVGVRASLCAHVWVQT